MHARLGYDAIVVGGGPSGLAAAVRLAEHGITDVAVLDRDVALARRGLPHGVDLVEGCEVTDILIHRGRVAGVGTTHGCIEAPHVVLAAGALPDALVDVGPLDGLFVS